MMKADLAMGKADLAMAKAGGQWERLAAGKKADRNRVE